MSHQKSTPADQLVHSRSLASFILKLLEVLNNGSIKETPYETRTIAGAIKIIDEVFIQGYGYAVIVPRYQNGGFFAVMDAREKVILTVMQTDDCTGFYINKTDAEYKNAQVVTCEYIANTVGNSHVLVNFMNDRSNRLSGQ